jgi:hypothetical protein
MVAMKVTIISYLVLLLIYPNLISWSFYNFLLLFFKVENINLNKALKVMVAMKVTIISYLILLLICPILISWYFCNFLFLFFKV